MRFELNCVVPLQRHSFEYPLILAIAIARRISCDFCQTGTSILYEEYVKSAQVYPAGPVGMPVWLSVVDKSQRADPPHLCISKNPDGIQGGAHVCHDFDCFLWKENQRSEPSNSGGHQADGWFLHLLLNFWWTWWHVCTAVCFWANWIVLVNISQRNVYKVIKRHCRDISDFEVDTYLSFVRWSHRSWNLDGRRVLVTGVPLTHPVREQQTDACCVCLPASVEPILLY